MKDKFNFGIFLKQYRNDEACLEHIKEIRYPKGVFCNKCQKITNFTKITDRPVYQCSCGYQISPLAGTIFEKTTTTSLQYWFYAIFIMSVTRSGVSAKQLQRELGVTYKTAWRMFKQIRILMANANKGGEPLDGIVEIDETYIGGRVKRRNVWGGGVENKQIVMGIVQRKGKAYLKHIPNTNMWTLIGQIKENVNPKAFVMTDDFVAYKRLYEHGYPHHYSVVHSDGQYVKWHGLVHNNTIEGMWSILKRGIYGVYRVVSKKYLQAYIDEYSWRYNNRKYEDGMFDRLLNEIASVKIVNS